MFVENGAELFKGSAPCFVFLADAAGWELVSCNSSIPPPSPARRVPFVRNL